MSVIVAVNIIVSVSLILGGCVMCKIKDNTDTSIGFKTEKSMKNNETWLFANRLCGKLWLVIGIFSLVFTVISAVFIKNLSVAVFGFHMFGMIFSMVYVEKKLKNNFDEDGKNINK